MRESDVKFRMRPLPLVLVVLLGLGLPVFGAIIADALSRFCLYRRRMVRRYPGSIGNTSGRRFWRLWRYS